MIKVLYQQLIYDVRAQDLHAVGNSMPIEDDVSNYELISAEETQHGTTVRFSRPWNTCDDKHDFEITVGTHIYFTPAEI